ncbi:MAG: cyclase [Chloroflexi bacterium]|nr:cyclase [Chloroflexota bacterium]MCY3581561.1 cyclase [Chloroflexota bacterium]MCY3717667.1 cyclase [Chloroflexota bacterium]MDE2649752.1 cyclase [Chloroflexota bacterium]MXX49961.1 cyclase [Chloroflexota bacterium]
MPPSQRSVYAKTSRFAVSLGALGGFHADPRALATLTPPPIFAQLLRDERRSLTEGEVEFRLWLGPLPLTWLARHEPGPNPDSFADLQVRGPLAYWRHEHIFREAPGGVELTDRVTLAHKPGLRGIFTRLVFDGLPLRILFAYRHWRTGRALRK